MALGFPQGGLADARLAAGLLNWGERRGSLKKRSPRGAETFEHGPSFRSCKVHVKPLVAVLCLGAMVLSLADLIDAAIAAETERELREILASVGMTPEDLDLIKPIKPPAERPN